MNDPRVLRQAHDQMRAALADLCDPIVRKQWRDDGSLTEHVAPSLLGQLREAVGNSRGRGGAPGKTAPIPISPDALDLLEIIERGTVGLVAHANAVPRAITIEAGLRAVVAAAGGWTDPDAVRGIHAQLASWARGIRDLLDPPTRLYLAAACPRCETSMVWRRDHTIGEDVQQPALQVDGHTGCTCLACGATWPPELFEHLAQVLGCPPLPTADSAA